MANSRLSYKEKRMVEDYLRDTLTEYEDGWRYKPGLSDAKVAEEFSHIIMGINSNNVKGVRVQMFGELYKPRKLTELDELRNSLDALGERVASLEQGLGIGTGTD